MLSNLIAGAAFGVALSASGVASPSVIIGQMRLQNFHMLQSFLAASACSAILVNVAARCKWAPISIRKHSSYGLVMPYDGNIIGGLLIGVGMTLTGACPGTVLVQVANNLRSGYFAALGCILGGVLFATLSPILRRTTPDDSESHTIQTKFHLTTRDVLLSYEVLCLSILALSSMVKEKESYWILPAVGGVIIGTAQALSLVLTRKTVGVSTAWEDMGRWICSWYDTHSGSNCSLQTPSVIFAAGLVLGSIVVAPVMPQPLVTSVQVHPLAAVLGGVSMVFGARLAGGCTSGHGISGMATFSVASFITVAAMFAGGITAALLC